METKHPSRTGEVRREVPGSNRWTSKEPGYYHHHHHYYYYRHPSLHDETRREPPT